MGKGLPGSCIFVVELVLLRRTIGQSDANSSREDSQQGQGLKPDQAALTSESLGPCAGSFVIIF
jgi:hypothetical protein